MVEIILKSIRKKIMKSHLIQSGICSVPFSLKLFDSSTLFEPRGYKSIILVNRIHDPDLMISVVPSSPTFQTIQKCFTAVQV